MQAGGGGKGAPSISLPQYNSYGKYCLKLFFMVRATLYSPLATRSSAFKFAFTLAFTSSARAQGCWRKLTVDDSIPFGADDRPLLPFIAKRPHELWPALLVKGLLKIAALEYPIPNTESVNEY